MMGILSFSCPMPAAYLTKKLNVEMEAERRRGRHEASRKHLEHRSQRRDGEGNLKVMDVQERGGGVDVNPVLW